MKLASYLQGATFCLLAALALSQVIAGEADREESIPLVVVIERKLQSIEDLNTWIHSIKSKVAGQILKAIESNTFYADRYMECAEMAQISGAFVCCSFYQQDLNEALTRMGVYMGAGKGFPPGTVLSQKNTTLINYEKLIVGHNLPGSILRQFADAVRTEERAEYQMNASEKAFLAGFLNHPIVAAKKDRFYLIGVSAQSTKPQESVVSHEIFHALYNLKPRFRDTINSFWADSVTDKDRSLIKAAIGKGYNTESEPLVIDEFQAYLLQVDANGDLLSEFVERYRSPLINTLRSAGELPSFLK